MITVMLKALAIWALILVGLSNIQDHLENPFDQIGQEIDIALVGKAGTRVDVQAGKSIVVGQADL